MKFIFGWQLMMYFSSPPFSIRNPLFFSRPVLEVARDLIGKEFVFHQFRGLITETEAYGGKEDAASHAYPGLTRRNQAMFGPGGRVYIYLIYGMYYCLNIVTGEEGSPGAVLIRGLRLPDLHLKGPGKICKHLGISKQEYGLNLLTHEHVYIAEGTQGISIKATPRIGITKATDKLWRFVEETSLDELFKAP